MIIEEEDFKLELNGDYERFDLSLLYVVNAKDPVKRREEFKDAGFSMTLDKCLNMIINFRISRRKEVLNFCEYVNEYKDERKKIEYISSMK